MSNDAKQPYETADAYERRMAKQDLGYYGDYAKKLRAQNSGPYTIVEVPDTPGSGGVPGQDKRDALRALMELDRTAGALGRSQGASLRDARVAEAERGERFRSRAAQGLYGGAMPENRLQTIVDSYRAKQAQVMNQRAGTQSERYSSMQDVRNVLDRRNYEAKLANAQRVMAKWNKLMEDQFNENALGYIAQSALNTGNGGQ